MNKEIYFPIQYHFQNIFSYETEYFIYASALILFLFFIYKEILVKSYGVKKSDVITKLSYLDELYKKKLIDKDEYESK